MKISLGNRGSSAKNIRSGSLTVSGAEDNSDRYEFMQGVELKSCFKLTSFQVIFMKGVGSLNIRRSLVESNRRKSSDSSVDIVSTALVCTACYCLEAA